jgi:hypothetical protein
MRQNHTEVINLQNDEESMIAGLLRKRQNMFKNQLSVRDIKKD